MTARLPPRVGRYQIKGELGRGRMGVVYDAHDTTLGRDVALKTIRLAESAEDEERTGYEQRFMTEARVAARLSHPGILVVHDVGRDPQTGLLYLAFERLHGRTLEEMLAGGKAVPWREAFRLAALLADALHHAHALGVIHRDIKPANIMVLSSGDPKIMDFGIAKAPASQLTRAGEIFGTPSFMSPEQARGRALDHRSDLFSLGAVLYQMLTGTKAFQGASTVATLTAVIDKDPPPPSRKRDDLPAEADYVTARALAKDRDDRYPDGQTLAEDLEDVLEGRAPRHRPGWIPKGSPPTTAPTPPLPEPTDPPTLVLELLDEPSNTKPNEVVPAVEARSGRASRRRRPAVLPLLAFMATVGLAFAAAAWWLLRGRVGSEPTPVTKTAPTASPGAISTVRPDLPPAAPRSPIPTTRAPSAPLAKRPSARAAAPPAAREPAARPSRLTVDFEHSLEAATLQVWVDGALVLQKELTGEVTRNLLVVRKRKGKLGETLQLRPGQREVRVRVSWDGDERIGTVSGTFEAGASRTLVIRLSGRRKTLSLEWQ